MTDMIKQYYSLLLIVALMFGATPIKAEEAATLQEARRVIDRFTGGTMEVNLELSLAKDARECDSYAYSVTDGVLTVKGSNGVALCHGFYNYVKSIHAGISSWSGNRFVHPVSFPEVTEVKVTSPYRDHYYLNVVTYGYTMPYWDEKRWDEELDWMVLHGIDMPLALVAQEAIQRRVWLRMGLTNTQIDDYFVGAAHLPWMRMGNISGKSLDGPQSANWDAKQIALMKHILARMRRLGMRPIVPAFAGFVPQTIQSLFPSANLTTTHWGGSFQNYRLDPEDALFKEMGTAFVQEWEKEFGECKYYLADSFNEMDVPNDLAKLTKYGDITYGSIKEANPNAVWVLQGWMLGYQRSNWTNGKLQAMMKNVPDDKMMILDMAADYNNHFWNNGYNWDLYPQFFGKEWVWSVIPNMGGKNCLTGRLNFYANGRLDALNSANKGNLTGYGFAPEGIENNEVIYELLTDGGWSSDAIDLDKWLANYAACRYGSNPQEITDYYTLMRSSVYDSFTDHPRYGWLMRPNDGSGAGSVNTNQSFFTGLEKFAEAAPVLGTNPLYKYDLIEAAVMYAGGKIEKLTQLIKAEIAAGDRSKAEALIESFTDLMLTTDQLLTCHPTFQLERWENMAMEMGVTAAEKSLYAKNARRIVSTWGYSSSRSVNDYAARVWSGLIRDYYLPRWLTYFDNKLNGKSSSITALEDAFVNAAPTLSAVTSVTDTLALCHNLIEKAKAAVEVTYERVTVIQPSTDVENHWYAIRSGCN